MEELINSSFEFLPTLRQIAPLLFQKEGLAVDKKSYEHIPNLLPTQSSLK
jgi:hypothetical protein